MKGALLFLVVVVAGGTQPEQPPDPRVETARALGKRHFRATAALSPVVLVPGLAGSVLEQQLDHVPDMPHAFCSATSPFARAWVRLSTFVPGLWSCFAFTMSRVWDAAANLWRERTGVSTRAVPGLAGIDYLDPANALTRRETLYFAATTAALVARGHVPDQTVVGLSYDWRLGPAEQSEEFWRSFGGTIEASVAAAGGRPAVIVSHSLGGIMVDYFLSNVASEAWKRTYVGRWVAVAAPFGGAPLAVRGLLSGYNFGISVLSSRQGLEVGPHLGSSFVLLPQPSLNWSALVTTTQGQSFGCLQFAELLPLANVSCAAGKVKLGAKSWQMAASGPGVEVVLAVGRDLDTEMSYTYDATDFGSGPRNVRFASGDGTVPLQSALLPLAKGWNVSAVKQFVRVDHVGLLANAEFIDWLLQQVTL